MTWLYAITHANKEHVVRLSLQLLIGQFALMFVRCIVDGGTKRVFEVEIIADEELNRALPDLRSMNAFGNIVTLDNLDQLQ